MGSPGNYPGRFLAGENPYATPENKAAAGGGGGGGDVFAVEDLLNFPNEEEEEEEAGGVVAAGSDEGGSDGAARNSTDTSTLTATESCSNSFSPVEAHFSGDLVCSSLAVSKSSGDFCETQYDELAELEWLSTFVEESFSSDDFHNLHLITAVNSTASTTSSSSAASSAASSSSTVGAKRTAMPAASGPSELGLIRREAPAIPAKARSKRSRATPSSWFSRLLVPRSPAATSPPDSELVALPYPPAFAPKKSAGAKKKETQSGSRAAAAAAEGRKCLHCQTDKTPQWRTGPLGPKTLCNACGVRYKSGRLVPEYRPAASPTFVYSEHSNSHRKVLELRRQKEIRQQLHSQVGDGTSHYDPSSSVSAAGFLIDGPDNIRRFI